MKSFRIDTSWLQYIEPLSDAERGRLWTAMLMWADSGETEELKNYFRGNERYLFPAFKVEQARMQSFADKMNGGKK